MIGRSSKKRIRYAVVGLGHIAQVAVLPAFENTGNSELFALVSNDQKKLKQLGKKYGIDHVYSYDDYSRALSNVDAVYLAVPNHLHREYAVRACAAGVHVLCEKPMAVTEEECRAMIEASQQNHAKLMIAYRLHFEAGNLEAIALGKSGKLGDLRIFTSEFSQQVADENVRVTESLSQGGGPLYDMGVYCINAARYLFQAEPAEVVAMSASKPEKRFSKVEEMMSAVPAIPERPDRDLHMQFRSVGYEPLYLAWDKGSTHRRSGIRICRSDQASDHDWRKDENKNLSEAGSVCGGDRLLLRLHC